MRGGHHLEAGAAGALCGAVDRHPAGGGLLYHRVGAGAPQPLHRVAAHLSAVEHRGGGHPAVLPHRGSVGGVLCYGCGHHAAHHLPGGQAAAECGVPHGPAVLGLEPVGLSGPFRAAVRGVLPDPHPAAAQPQSGHTARAHDDFYHGGLPAEHEHLRQPVQRL